MKHLLWAVILDEVSEEHWRHTISQEDMDDWCAAHGWRSRDIRSGSVCVYAYRNGHTEVTAETPVLDSEGKLMLDEETNRIRTRTVVSPLKRSLPEGIGTVIR